MLAAAYRYAGWQRDAAVATTRLIREAVILAGERLYGAPDPLTASRLTAALQRNFPGTYVRAIEPLTDDHGTTDRMRYGVTYSVSGSGKAPPSTVFVKRPPRAVMTRLFVNLIRLGSTEVRFYQEIAPQVPVAMPPVFVAECDGAAQRFTLVFEDLAPAARFIDVATPLTIDEARMVVRALGVFHAAFWESRRFGSDLAWTRGPGNTPNAPLERFVCALAVQPALQRFADLVPAELHAAAPGIIARRDRLETAWAQAPLTLVHGDCHAGNLYFGSGTVGFLDWQVVQRGQGMRDVAYFLITSVPTELRRRSQRDLVEEYLSVLATQGVQAPTSAQAWSQYRRHALYAWIATVVTAAATRLQAETIVRTGLARSSAAVMDLEALGALAEL